MARFILFVFLSIIIKLSLATTNIEIIYSPDSILFQNTSQALSSSDLSKLISQCLGYTTKKPYWDGFNGYKNIAKNIPKSVVIFHMPISLSSIATHTFPITIDSNLSEEYVQTKDAMLSRHNHNNVLADYVIFNDKLHKNPNTMESQIESLQKYLNKIEARNGHDEPALLWFELFADKDKLNVDNVEAIFGKLMNQVKHLFGNDLLVMSIHDDENQIAYQRIARQSSSDDKKKNNINLAHEYAHDFHTSFVSIGFAAILFVLAVFVISVSMWNIDPGRDSIIYRLTSQKFKKDQ